MKKGRFGEFGGQYVPEMLMNALLELEEAYEKYSKDKKFQAELKKLLDTYAGRPSELYFAKKMTEDLGGAKIYLKREDLNHTGSHKINNAIGQVLLAKRLGYTHIIAETGAGQHGVATATVCSLFNIKCTIFMGKEDIRRQRVNVEKMKLLGADVREVTRGEATLKEAVDEASLAIKLAQQYGCDLPIYIDNEWGNSNGTGRGDKISVEQRTANIIAFCETVKNAGFTPGVYSGAYWYNSSINFSAIAHYNIWVAHYTTASKPNFAHKYYLWQFTSQGIVDGINTNVDVNRFA